MSETTTPTIETAPTAETTPQPATTEAPKGIAGLMADIERAAEGKPAAAPEPEKSTAKIPDKPAATTPTPKPEAATAKPGPTKPVEGPAELRRRLQEVQQSEKARLAEIETLRKQNQELSQRRYVTPEMEKEIEANKAQMNELRRQMAESAYERSDDFKRDYVQPYNQAREAAVAAVEQYQVTINEDGETRPATKADFWKIASAAPADRAQLAHAMFGPNAINVLSDLRDLERIRLNGEAAIKRHGEERENRSRQEEEQGREMQKNYETHRQTAREKLTELYPQLFGDPEDPELAEAWKKGNEFVDQATTRAANMPVEERATVAEVMRARAAWFPRGYHELNKAKAKIGELETELAKYRQSEPGSERETSVKPEAKDELSGGIEALGARFEKLMQ